MTLRRKRETHILVPSKRFQGVFWDPEKDYWRVVIKMEDEESTADGGHSLSEEEAAHMADECVLELRAGIPVLNFPEEEEKK